MNHVTSLRSCLLAVLLSLFLVAACDALNETATTPGPSVVPTSDPSAQPTGASASGIARLGYLPNILAGVEAGRWNYDEGLELSLRALIGAANPRLVLGRQPLASHDLTGLVAAARERLVAAPPDGTAVGIESALRFLSFDGAQLRAMVVPPGAPLPTSPGLSPPPRPDPNDPDPEDTYFDPGSPAYDLDCELFFRRFPVSPDATTCLLHRDRSTASSTYSVFWPVPSIAPFYWTETHQRWIDEALADSVALYADLGRLPPVDVVLGVNLDAPGEALTVSDGDDCVITLYSQAQHRAEGVFKQLVARQLAHCLQVASHTELADTPFQQRSWRQDGLAAYLSNLVYPAADLEHETLEAVRQIDDESSLFDWAGGAFVWFQFAGERLGAERLLEVFGSLPAGAVSEEVAALAEWPELAGLYHDFALAYTDGVIRDSSGERIPTDWRPGDQDGALVDAPGRHAVVDVPAFAMRRSMLTVPSDRLARLGPQSAVAGAQTSARSYGGGRTWGAVPDTFPRRCLEDNRLLVVTTSTRPDSYRRSIDVESFDVGCP